MSGDFFDLELKQIVAFFTEDQVSSGLIQIFENRIMF